MIRNRHIKEIKVNVNTDLIVQSVKILLDNSIKHTPDNGEICIGVKLGDEASGQVSASPLAGAGRFVFSPGMCPFRGSTSVDFVILTQKVEVLIFQGLPPCLYVFKVKDFFSSYNG